MSQNSDRVAAPTPETPSLIEAVEQFIAAAESYRCASAPVTDHFVTLEVAMIDARNKLRALLLAGAVSHPQPEVKFATDAEVRDSAQRMVEKHRRSLEKLSDVAHPVVSPRDGFDPCANCGHHRNLHFGGCNDWESPPCKCECFTPVRQE